MAEGLELRGKPRSVRRFNRRALIGIVGSASVIILGAAAFALRSPDRTGGAAPQELYNTTMKALPDGLTDMPVSYADVKRDAPKLGPPLPGDLGAAMIGREREPVRQDNPFRYEPARPSYSRGSHQTAQPSPQAQLAESARTSKLFFISHDGGGDAGGATAKPTGLSLGNQFAGLLRTSPGRSLMVRTELTLTITWLRPRLTQIVKNAKRRFSERTLMRRSIIRTGFRNHCRLIKSWQGQLFRPVSSRA